MTVQPFESVTRKLRNYRRVQDKFWTFDFMKEKKTTQYTVTATAAHYANDSASLCWMMIVWCLWFVEYKFIIFTEWF